MKNIRVSDSMQDGYTYRLVEPVGKNFNCKFQPELTPPQMLALGVFGGMYMNDCVNAFPHSWYKQARLSNQGKDARLNYFKVDASQPLSEWQKKGWIHPQDPRGWFQWYCRYFMGRRSEDDERQIQRWKAFRRHIGAVRKNCERYDECCRPRQRQALLHWAYDARNI